MYCQKNYFCFVRVHKYLLIMGLEVFIITHTCPQDTKNRVTLEEANPGWYS